MSRRIDRLYDEAIIRGSKAQIALRDRMKTVRDSIPAWFQTYENLELAYRMDAECRRLRAAVDTAWSVTDLRLAQLRSAKAVANG